MKKKNEQALQKAFDLGLSLGFSLAGLGGRIAPKLVGRSEREIIKLLEREIDVIFKEFEKASGPHFKGLR